MRHIRLWAESSEIRYYCFPERPEAHCSRIVAAEAVVLGRERFVSCRVRTGAIAGAFCTATAMRDELVYHVGHTWDGLLWPAEPPHRDI